MKHYGSPLVFTLLLGFAPALTAQQVRGAAKLPDGHRSPLRAGEGHRDVSALKGQLVFDRRTFGLRLRKFEFVARPRWPTRGSAGGELRFAQLPDGAWVPASWELRVPRPKVGSDRPFYGMLEAGGRVSSVRLNGRPDPAAAKAVAEALRYGIKRGA